MRAHIYIYTHLKKHVHKNKHDHIITSYYIYMYVYIYIDIQMKNYQQLCHYVHDTWRTGLPSPPCVQKLHHSRSPQ